MALRPRLIDTHLRNLNCAGGYNYIVRGDYPLSRKGPGVSFRDAWKEGRTVAFILVERGGHKPVLKSSDSVLGQALEETTG